MKRIALDRLMQCLVDRGFWTESDLELVRGRLGNRQRWEHAIDSAQTTVNFYEALDMLMVDALERFAKFKAVVDGIDANEDELTENRAVLARFDVERGFAARIAKDALGAEIDKRRLALDEAKADQVVRALARAAAEAGLTPQQEEDLTRLLAAEMKALPVET